jgi:hypothetical protein
MLNETKIRNAKPRERPYKLYDERGLFLLVTPTDGRLWRLKDELHGREKLISLGAYPDVTLKRARGARQRDALAPVKSKNFASVTDGAGRDAWSDWRAGRPQARRACEKRSHKVKT